MTSPIASTACRVTRKAVYNTKSPSETTTQNDVNKAPYLWNHNGTSWSKPKDGVQRHAPTPSTASNTNLHPFEKATTPTSNNQLHRSNTVAQEDSDVTIEFNKLSQIDISDNEFTNLQVSDSTLEDNQSDLIALETMLQRVVGGLRSNFTILNTEIENQYSQLTEQETQKLKSALKAFHKNITTFSQWPNEANLQNLTQSAANISDILAEIRNRFPNQQTPVMVDQLQSTFSHIQSEIAELLSKIQLQPADSKVGNPSSTSVGTSYDSTSVKRTVNHLNVDALDWHKLVKSLPDNATPKQLAELINKMDFPSLQHKILANKMLAVKAKEFQLSPNAPDNYRAALKQQFDELITEFRGLSKQPVAGKDSEPILGSDLTQSSTQNTLASVDDVDDVDDEDGIDVDHTTADAFSDTNTELDNAEYTGTLNNTNLTSSSTSRWGKFLTFIRRFSGVNYKNDRNPFGDFYNEFRNDIDLVSFVSLFDKTKNCAPHFFDEVEKQLIEMDKADKRNG